MITTRILFMAPPCWFGPSSLRPEEYTARVSAQRDPLRNLPGTGIDHRHGGLFSQDGVERFSVRMNGQLLRVCAHLDALDFFQCFSVDYGHDGIVVVADETVLPIHAEGSDDGRLAGGKALDEIEAYRVEHGVGVAGYLLDPYCSVRC